MNVDVILVVSTQAALAAKAATSSIPIVLVGVLDPERTGLVASLGKPGGNVTGISNQLLELQMKQLQLFKEALPHLTRGMTTISGPIAKPDDLERTLAAVAAQRPSGLYIHLVVGPYRSRIIEFALSQRLPTFVSDSRWAEEGALLTYGPDVVDILRRSAGYVVEQPSKFDLAINLKTAKALGLTLPPALLALAAEIIE